MAWKIEFTFAADRQFYKLDKTVANRIKIFLDNRIATAIDPRKHGTSLKGEKYGDLWKFRVGDYRIICEIQNEALIVLVVKIGHRGDVYRKK